MLGLWQFKDVPDQYKTQEMCDKAVCVDPWSLGDVTDNLKTQGMCMKAFWEEPYTLECVPDQYITRGMHNEVVCGRPRLLKYMPDWFVTQEDEALWHDYVYSDEGLIKWYDGYQKRKAQKVSIKEELMPIAWHPSRWWDWCVPEDKKKETEKLWR